MSCGNECNRCDRDCKPVERSSGVSGGGADPAEVKEVEIGEGEEPIERVIDVEETYNVWCDLRYLIMKVAELIEPIEIGGDNRTLEDLLKEVKKQIDTWEKEKKEKERDCREGIECIEKLAVYCCEGGWERIYYNNDRVERWVHRMAREIIAAFIIQLVKDDELRSIVNDLVNLKKPMREIYNIALNVSNALGLGALMEHERYHWSEGCCNDQPEVCNARNCDGEAKASAYGIYVAINGPERPMWWDRRAHTGEFLQSLHMHLHPPFDIDDDYFLTLILREYAVERLVFVDMSFACYHNFYKYLSAVRSKYVGKHFGHTRLPWSRRGVVHVRGSAIRLPWLGLEISFHHVVKVYDVEFTGPRKRRPYRDELMEIWACCDNWI